MSGRRGGPRTYALELARRLPAAAPDLSFTWLSETPVPELARCGLGIASLRLVHPALRPLWDHLGVPGVIRRTGADLYHNTKNALPLFSAGPKVVTVHDLAHRRMPDTFSRPARLYLEFHTRRAALAADQVITVSRSTRSDLLEAYGLDPARVSVVPNGVSSRYLEVPEEAGRRARRRLGLPDGYVLFAGTLQPRKNPDVVLEAWRSLPDPVRKRVALVFAGRVGWKSELLRRRIGDAVRAENVRLLTDVPDEDLPGLYAGAELFVSPSSYEGFGLTVLEAMACGVPVVAGDSSSVPEVVGDAAVLVPPRDVRAVGRAMAELLSSPDRCAALAQRGRRRASRFTWERTAGGTAAVYREVLARTARASR
jgi:glycosyltransferase involved in cell wall biosynthesis